MCIPLLLIYVVYKNILIEKNISIAYKIIVILISGSIVITNLLGISLATYQNTTISANFISWFFEAYDHYSYMQLASKGFFYFANHIIAILLLMLPIIFYFLAKDFNKKNIGIFLLLLLSMILLGNKISVFGSFLVLITLIILYLIFTKIKQELKFNKKLLISLIITTCVYAVLMFYSPAYQRVITVEGTVPNYTTNEGITMDKIDYIRDNYKSKKILKQFIEKSYPYTYDPDFWINIMKESETNRIDYRFLEISMMNRVIEINSNPTDKLLGIGYTREMNIFNVERDYLNQYYSLGVIGLILFIGPYIILFGYGASYIIIKKKINFKNSILLFSIVLILIAAYFSGNLFNSLSVMIPLAYVYGILLSSLNSNKML